MRFPIIPPPPNASILIMFVSCSPCNRMYSLCDIKICLTKGRGHKLTELLASQGFGFFFIIIVFPDYFKDFLYLRLILYASA